MTEAHQPHFRVPKVKMNKNSNWRTLNQLCLVSLVEQLLCSLIHNLNCGFIFCQLTNQLISQLFQNLIWICYSLFCCFNGHGGTFKWTTDYAKFHTLFSDFSDSNVELDMVNKHSALLFLPCTSNLICFSDVNTAQQPQSADSGQSDMLNMTWLWKPCKPDNSLKLMKVARP